MTCVQADPEASRAPLSSLSRYAAAIASPPAFHRAHAGPFHALDQRRQLCCREAGGSILDPGPAESALLQPFRKETETRAVPPNQLDSVRSLHPEHEHRAREWIVLQVLLHQCREPVHPFAEVDRPRRHQDPDRATRHHHRAERSAFTSATIVPGRVPAGTRSFAPLSSISMTPLAAAAGLLLFNDHGRKAQSG
jgi:hypothetical protein